MHYNTTGKSTLLPNATVTATYEANIAPLIKLQTCSTSDAKQHNHPQENFGLISSPALFTFLGCFFTTTTPSNSEELSTSTLLFLRPDRLVSMDDLSSLD
jgi:hypothetical protein